MASLFPDIHPDLAVRSSVGSGTSKAKNFAREAGYTEGLVAEAYNGCWEPVRALVILQGGRALKVVWAGAQLPRLGLGQ